MIRLSLMPHQQAFCGDIKTDYLALIGGTNCGKTNAFCRHTIIMAGVNAGYEGAIAEPTNHLVATHLIPNMEEALAEMKVPYEFDKTHKIFYMHFKEGTTKVYCLSGENYQRIIAYNLAFFGTDETDTSGFAVAAEMWKRAVGRVRVGPYRQIYSTSTPEGYLFLHDFFVQKPQDAGKLEVIMGTAKGFDGQYIKEHRATMSTVDPDTEEVIYKTRRAIHATSYDSPFTDKAYMAGMRSNYTAAQWLVWAMGQFGNLNSSRVYYEFDRKENHSNETLSAIADFESVHWGLDFNIDHMAAVCHIIKDGKPIAVNELIGVKDVPAMIVAIKKVSGKRPVYVYPDASGKNRNAMTGDLTAHAQLRQAGFKVVVDGTNPGVGDRINSMNAMFHNAEGKRRYLVNTQMCPQYTRSLEQQSWVKKRDELVPDKSNNIDHPLDAAGYFIHKNWPLTGRPTLRTTQ